MERWVWYGGRPALDLVNTRRARAEAGAEYLRTPADLADWLTAAGTPTPSGDVDDALLAEAVELREAIDAGVRAAVDRTVAPAAAIATLNRWLAPAGPLSLSVDGGVTVLVRCAEPDPVRQALQGIAVDAAHLLGTADRDQLRICSGAHCQGRFADASPARRRRWCSMAVCGNRAKAARHRKVQRG